MTITEGTYSVSWVVCIRNYPKRRTRLVKAGCYVIVNQLYTCTCSQSIQITEPCVFKDK